MNETERTFYIVLKVAHDEDLGDGLAIDAVLKGLCEGLEGLVFPLFAKDRLENEHAIRLVDYEFYPLPVFSDGVPDKEQRENV